MIPVNSILFQASLQELAKYKKSVGNTFKGRLIQLFLGLKFYQNQIPSMHSGRFISAEVIQILLDDLYAKSAKPIDSSVLMIFEGNYLARTGVRAVNNSGGQNTWRNNLNIQKGIGCYAPANILAGSTFLNAPREQCQYLSRPKSNLFSGSSCNLCSSGKYRNEQHRKWLQIDTNHNGYAAIDSSDIKNFQAYISPKGNRIPILPLIIALYHDANMGLILSQRTGGVDIQDFESDFNLSHAEFITYFDDSPLNPHNQEILSAGNHFNYTQVANVQSNIPPKIQMVTQTAK
jgi:hypothetical protein